MPLWKQQPEYERLRQRYAESRGEFAFWIGSGLSQPADLPNWSGLLQQLHRAALHSIATLEEREARIQEAKLDELHYIDNFWDKMTRVKDVMGPASFNSSIDDIIGRSTKLAPPLAYDEIWRLDHVNNVLCFNLDCFINRSHQQIRGAQHIATFSGCEAHQHTHLIKNRRPFIANLHGTIDNPSSWVLTKSQIKALLEDASYRYFVSAVLQSFTCVFVGITADDVAVSSFLHQIRDLGVMLGDHYWITSRSDAKTHRWGQDAGLQVIRYQPQEGPSGADHVPIILDLLKDIRSYIPPERSAPVVQTSVDTIDSIPSASELLTRTSNEIRQLLTRKAFTILSVCDHNTESPSYKEFLTTYRRAIYLSWFVSSDSSPDNEFFDYVLSDKIASSLFSSVWRAYDRSGNSVAVKLINIDNLSRGIALESFRRGVESLSFLTNAKIDGVALLREAHELPPCVVMDFVEGGTFEDVVQSSDFEFWEHG
jgi:hypothetical protein